MGPFRVVPPLRLAALFLAAALVSACGGGGGGSGSSASTGEPGPDVGASCIETQMFGCLEGKKWGLSRVRTERAWARLEQEYGSDTAPGSGQTVGVVDSGIDRDNRAFCGGSAPCAKTVTEEFLDGATDEDGSRRSHGTAVAGVIASRLTGAPGIAWGADIAMFAIPLGAPGGDYVPVSLTALGNRDDTFASIFGTVLGWSDSGRTLDFVNLSFGYRGIIDSYGEQEFRSNFGDTIAALAQSGVADKTVLVWAAGNANGRSCDPADFAGNPDLCESYVEAGVTKHRVVAKSVEVLAGLPVRIAELRDHVVSVVAVDRDGRIASFSNRCGIAAEWCLAAPGVGIRTAYFGPHPDTGEPGARGTYEAGGTSFAAPMVTGALVVMKHYFRDQLPNTDLVSRMLATANDRGVYSDRSIYGHGLLDLDAAVRPVGTTGFALGDAVGGPGAPVGRTGFLSGGAFGDALAQSFAGREIAAFDALGAPFWFGLGGFARAPPRAPALARLGAFMTPEPPPAVAGTANRSDRPSPLGGFAPAGRDVGREGLRQGFVDVPAPAPGGGHLSLARTALAFDADGPGGLGFAVFSTEGMHGRSPVSGAMLSWRPAPNEPEDRAGAPLKLTAGWIGERETMLGSRPAGAFGRLSAGSAFVGVDGGARLDAWRLDASAEFGMARAAAGGGMVTGVSPLATSAFALRAERPLDAAGSLRLSVSQPLRVESGRARLSIPVGRTRDGRVLRRPLSADLAPSGRQIDLGARWRKPLADGGELRLGAVWALQPGHDAAASAELTAMAGYRRSF